MTIEAIAEAFSRHAFRDTYPYMAEDVRWDLVGAALLEGRVAVVAACEESADQLGAVQTHFTAFRVRNGIDFVVVDSTADYVDGDALCPGWRPATSTPSRATCSRRSSRTPSSCPAEHRA